MEKTYIRILKESLCRKKELLESLTKCNKRQEEILRQEVIDWKAFDEETIQKEKYIDELTRLDEGFDLIFAKVKEELVDHKEEYKEDILFMKKLIQTISDLSASLESGEYRNKAMIEQCFQKERSRINKKRVSAKVASVYYQNTKQINYVDPQMLDKRK